MKGTLISTAIAEPYAQALMSVAQSNDLTEQFGQDFRELDRLFEESVDLQEFIVNPVIGDEDKKAVIRQIMGEAANPLLINFLMLLVDKRRIIFLREVVDQYLERLRKLNQTVLADVTTAQDLNDQQRAEIEAKVKAMTQAQGVELKTTVNPAILGGVIIRVGSQVLDASLKGQLRRIGVSLDA